MLRSTAVDDDFVSGIVPAQTVLWSGAEPAPGALRDLLAECGYALHGRDLSDWPARRVAWLSPATLAARDKYALDQRRLAVVHPDPGAADALAEALRARGAQVIVLSLEETGLDRAEALDPDAVILQPERFWPSGRAVINALWQHPWLRWTPVLFAPAERLGSAGASAPDVRELALGVRTLSAGYDLCSKRASRGEPFEQPLAQLGPVRTLRALLESRRTLRLRLEAPERVYELDLGEGLVIGARVAIRRGVGWQELLGVHAVKSLLARMDGRVLVTPVEHPALANVMAPLEAVLLSGREAPPLSDPPRATELAAPPVRAQATLLGMPAPVLGTQQAQAAAPAAPASVTSLVAPRDSHAIEPGEDDDASPTRAFRTSLRPSRAPLPEREVSAPPAPRWGGGALWAKPAREISLALALLAASAGALWAWPRAQPAAPLAWPASSAAPSVRAAPFATAPVRALVAAADRPEPPASSAAQAGDASQTPAARAKKLVLKGTRLRKVGRLRAARQAYQAALAAQPHMPRALAGLVELQLAQHDAAQALVTVQELLKQRHTPDDQRLLGDVYMLAGRREEALAAYGRAAARGNATARARLKKHNP